MNVSKDIFLFSFLHLLISKSLKVSLVVGGQRTKTQTGLRLLYPPRGAMLHMHTTLLYCRVNMPYAMPNISIYLCDTFFLLFFQESSAINLLDSSIRVPNQYLAFHYLGHCRGQATVLHLTLMKLSGNNTRGDLRYFCHDIFSLLYSSCMSAR